MKTLITILSFYIVESTFGQNTKNILTVQEDTTHTQRFRYFFVNQGGDTTTKLDTTKYYMCWSSKVEYFAIVGLKNKHGWWAINSNEKILFQVYNTSFGEPSPDILTDGMIRIIDSSGKIGFANYKGEIIIKPQFEAATSFYNGKAIIGKQCKQILWCCAGENTDKHYKTDCSQIGYINERGEIQQLGNLTFEQMAKKIDWQTSE